MKNTILLFILITSIFSCKNLEDDVNALKQVNQSQQQEIDSLIKQIDSLSSTINDSNLKQSQDYDNLLSTINTLIDNTNNLTNQKFEILSDSIKNIRGDLITVSLESNNLSSQLSNLSSELEILKNDNSQQEKYNRLYESFVLLQSRLDSINAIPKKLFNGRNYRTNYIIQGSIFKVSYNEIYEQPNWLEYTVRNVPSNVSRSGYDFFTVDSVFTSNIDDYAANDWDKGHLAPAASFDDTVANLTATFSFLNCVLQHYYLNRYEWAQLEGQVRDWAAADNADIDVRVDIIFDYGHQTLPTGAHVPSAFRKTLNFANGTKKCFYFPNSHTNGKDWTEFEISCN